MPRPPRGPAQDAWRHRIRRDGSDKRGNYELRRSRNARARKREFLLRPLPFFFDLDLDLDDLDDLETLAHHFQNLATLQNRTRLNSHPKGLIVFDIDGTKWALELRPGKEKKVTKGAPDDKPDVTLVIADADFAKLVAGASPQTMFLTRKLKIQGSMAVALKTQSILAAARPKAKL